MAVMCVIAWVMGDPIGFVDISVGREMMVFPILGWTILQALNMSSALGTAYSLCLPPVSNKSGTPASNTATPTRAPTPV